MVGNRLGYPTSVLRSGAFLAGVPNAFVYPSPYFQSANAHAKITIEGHQDIGGSLSSSMKRPCFWVWR